MFKAGGYAVLTSENGVKEMDTFSCRHCNRVTHIKAFARPEDIGGRCGCCDGLICSSCVGEPCLVLEERLKRMEARDEARRSYGI